MKYQLDHRGVEQLIDHHPTRAHYDNTYRGRVFHLINAALGAEFTQLEWEVTIDSALARRPNQFGAPSNGRHWFNWALREEFIKPCPR